MTARRVILFCLLALGTTFPLFACKADNNPKNSSMQKEIVMDVVIFSYLNRTIFDVYLDGKDIGVAGPFGGGGVVTGVSITSGLQTLKWTLDGPEGTPGNGNQVIVKNKLIVDPSLVPAGIYYMAVHIYPDDTAELSFSKGIPERSIRGIKIVEEFQKHHGQ